MAEFLFDVQSAPATPAAGQVIVWPDSTAKGYAFKNEAGRAGMLSALQGVTFNGSIAAVGPGFAADTYLTDSDLLIPSFGLQVRTKFKWLLSFSKTAAGTATPVYSLRIGANRTTADTARLQITGPAQTAAADVGVVTIIAIVRSVGAAGVLQGSCNFDHNGAAVGFADNNAGAVEATGAGFDNSALAGQYVGLSINGGASAAWTLTQVQAEAMW